MDTLVYIGASKEAIEAARDAILEILAVPSRGDKVVGQALQAFTTVCEVKANTFHGMTLYGGDAPGAHVHHHAAPSVAASGDAAGSEE